jgi:uncharacterized membrane protein
MKLDLGNVILVYAVTAGVFFIVDLFWLGFAAKGLYQRHLGGLMRDQVNWIAAVAFYAVYIGGIQIFVMIPALQNETDILRTAVMGALLGFFAYSTFDLTSLALMRNWTVGIAVVDIAWGTVLTGSTVAMAMWVVRAVFKIG